MLFLYHSPPNQHGKYPDMEVWADMNRGKESEIENDVQEDKQTKTKTW